MLLKGENMKALLTITTLLLLVFSWKSSVARNMENRFGFGMTINNLGNLPGISFRSPLSKYQSFGGVFAVDTTDGNRLLVLGGKLYQNTVLEENLNFYLGLGAFLEQDGRGGTATTSGFEFQGIVGAEFFLPGLPNLGFAFETGIGIRTLRQVSIHTLGTGFLGSSVHCYF